MNIFSVAHCRSHRIQILFGDQSNRGTANKTEICERVTCGFICRRYSYLLPSRFGRIRGVVPTKRGAMSKDGSNTARDPIRFAIVVVKKIYNLLRTNGPDGWRCCCSANVVGGHTRPVNSNVLLPFRFSSGPVHNITMRVAFVSTYNVPYTRSIRIYAHAHILCTHIVYTYYSINTPCDCAQTPTRYKSQRSDAINNVVCPRRVRH